MPKQSNTSIEQGVQDSEKNNSESKVLVNAPFQMMFAEGYSLGFLEMFDKNKASMTKMLEKWRKPILNASETHFVKNLVNYGLLTPKIEDGKILLSYIEIIYVEMLRIVFEFGGNPKLLKSLKFLFDEQYRDNFATNYTPLAEILVSGHDGLDVEFAYSIGDKEITAYDYLFAPLFLGRQKSATVQFSLIPILNDVRKIFKNLEPIKTRHSMYDGFNQIPLKEDMLTNAEMKTIEKMRCLKDSQTLSLKTKKGEDGKYVMSIGSDNDDKKLAKDFETFCKQHSISDFSDVRIKTRNGGVADVKISEQEII